jgi:hypothetical protein
VIGFSAALQRNGPFFLLAATVVGASLFSASAILPKASPWAFTPIFAVPVCLALWGWGRIGLIQAVLWIAALTGAHFLAIEATILLAGMIGGTGLLGVMASFGGGGLVGAGLSLGALLLLGRRLLNNANFTTALVGLLVMGIVAGLCGALSMHKSVGAGPNIFRAFRLTLFVPWQLVFGAVILAVVEGRLVPAKNTEPKSAFLPPDTIWGGALAGVVACVALLGFALAKPDLFKKPALAAAPAAAATSGGKSFSPAR